MIHDLDTRLAQWLETGGAALQSSIDEEIDNRITQYADLRRVLGQQPVDVQALVSVVRKCWLFSPQKKRMNFEAFVANENYARRMIGFLLDDLPDSPRDQEDHIDQFVEEVVATSFNTADNSRDFAGALTFASLLLTTMHPRDFVDYPSHIRWQKLVMTLGYTWPQFESRSDHGKRLLWVSDFARSVASQELFKRLWAAYEPMWVVGGLCWSAGVDLTRRRTQMGLAEDHDRAPEWQPVDYTRLSFHDLRQRALDSQPMRPAPQMRQASYYARSQTIKAYALRRADGVCEGCGSPAPFEKPSGEPFLEVHHIYRLSDGGPDAPDAVAALCPNCHRRAHHAQDAAAFNAALAARISDLERGYDAEH